MSSELEVLGLVDAGELGRGGDQSRRASSRSSAGELGRGGDRGELRADAGELSRGGDRGALVAELRAGVLAPAADGQRSTRA